MPTAVQRSPLVLCVDDNAANLQLVRDHLDMKGIECHGFTDPKAALRALTWDRPDLILLDLHMPEIPGDVFLSRVADLYGSEAPPCVMLSCDDGEDALTRCFEAGAVDYMTKPFSHGELIAKVRRHMGEIVPRSAQIEPLGPDETIGPYVVRREIGRGGMGIVLEVARADCPDFPLALKLLLTNKQDMESLLRFRREIDILAELNHPNLARMLDAGRHRGTFYYVMDYVDGQPLDVYFKKLPFVTSLTIARVMHQILLVLEYLHGKGILHRDLKPGNLIVDKHGKVWVIDFGLARSVLDSQLTRHSQMVGTPNFLAPEVIEGERPTERSDLFGLGMVMLECMLGDFAINEENTYTIIHRLVQGDYPRASSIDGAHPGLALVVDRMLERKPNQRFISARSGRLSLEREFPELRVDRVDSNETSTGGSSDHPG